MSELHQQRAAPIQQFSGTRAMSDDVSVEHGQITRLLIAARQGDTSAIDRVVPLVYNDLRALARRQLARAFS